MRSLTENTQSKKRRQGAESSFQETSALKRFSKQLERKKEDRKIWKTKERIRAVKGTGVRSGKVRNLQLTGPLDLSKKGSSRSLEGEFSSGMSSEWLIRKKKPKSTIGFSKAYHSSPACSLLKKKREGNALLMHQIKEIRNHPYKRAINLHTGPI